MAKRKSIYANMTASDLAHVTRERGLEKPNVITLSEWADFLEADDLKQAAQAVAPDADRDTEDSAPDIEPKDKKGKK